MTDSQNLRAHDSSGSVQHESEVGLDASPFLKLSWKFGDLEPPPHELQETQAKQEKCDEKCDEQWYERRRCLTFFRLKAGWVVGSGHGPQWGTWASVRGSTRAKRPTKNAFMFLAKHIQKRWRWITLHVFSCKTEVDGAEVFLLSSAFLSVCASSENSFYFIM